MQPKAQNRIVEEVLGDYSFDGEVKTSRIPEEGTNLTTIIVEKDGVKYKAIIELGKGAIPNDVRKRADEHLKEIKKEMNK